MMKRIIILINLFVLFSVGTYSQNDGDFLSKQTGNWNVAGNWYIWSDLDFGYIDAPDYPKSNNTTVITIATGHTITLPSGVTLTNISGKITGQSSAHMVIDGSLTLTSTGQINGGSVTTYFPNITINGTLNVATVCNCTNFIVNSGGKFRTTFYHATAQSQGWWFTTYAPSTGGSSLNGTVEFAGAPTQNIATLLPYNNLEISTDGTTVSGTLQVNGNTTISTGNSLIIAASTDATLTNVSIADANALVMNSGASLIIDGTLSGTGASSVVVRRTVTEDAWHLVSPPHSDYSMTDLLAENNIDQHNTTSEYALADFDENTNTWNTYLAPSANMNPGQGYLTGVSDPGATTLSMTGTPNYGDQTSLFSLVNTNKGMNASGNPFTSSLDVDAFLSHTGNINAINNSYLAIYTYNPATNSYDANVGSFGQDHIQPCQGFMLNADADGGAVSFLKSMQSHSNTTFYKKSASGENQKNIQLNLQIDNKSLKTEIYFTENAGNGLDPGKDLGLMKFKNESVMYSRLIEDNGVKFMIQSLPENYSSLSIPIGVDFPAGGPVSFSAAGLNLPEQCKIILEDKSENTFTDLKVPDSQYQVVLSAGTEGTGRFFLHTFDPRTVNVDINDLENITIFAFEKEILVQGDLKFKSMLYLYDITGRLRLSQHLETGNLNRIQASGLENGIYIVRVISGQKEKTGKLILQ